MHILVCIVLFVLGLVLIVKGGDVFVDAAEKIAKAMKIPSFIIGATIVSIATTLPEMIVSVSAASEGKVDMAIGNAVGSVTCNTALIMAIAMICMSIVCERKKYLRQIILLIAATAILTLACLGGELHLVGAILLLVIFVLFMTQNVISAKKESSNEEENENIDKKEVLKNVLLFVVGAAGIVIGSRLLVDNGSELAKIIGVSERVIAVTFVAIGTSLPELVTTITAIVKKKASLSIGNVIGANIIDTTLILPLCSLVSGKNIPVSQIGMKLDIPASLVMTLVAVIPLIIMQKAKKWQGFLLLIIYAVYVALTCGLIPGVII